MIITSELLASLAASIDKAQPEYDDVQLRLSSSVSPTVVLCKPMLGTTTFGPIQRSSFHLVHAAQSRNQGAATTDGPILSKGLWEFDLSFTYISNWDNSASNTPQATYNIAYPNGLTASIAAFQSMTVSTHLTNSIKTKMLVPVDFVKLTWFLQTTGVGQITIGHCGVIGNKLF